MKPTLTFSALRRVNLARLPEFKLKNGRLVHTEPDGSDWSVAEWTNALAGEAGEAANYGKKLRRGDYGDPGDASYQEGLVLLGKELADVVIYADLTASRIGLDLGEVVVSKFNEVSNRVGSTVRVELSPDVPMRALYALLKQRANDTFSCKVLVHDILALLERESDSL